MRPPRLLSLSPSPQSPLILFLSLPQNLHSPNSSITFHCYYTKNKKPSSHSSRKSSYWDSNGETSGSSKFKFFDEDVIGVGDDEYEEGYNPSSRFHWSENRKKKKKWWSDKDDDDLESGNGVIEDVIDNVWFIKVLRSFGWLLPAILITMLVSTGPKAFLMAIALPLGQSLLSYAFDKVFRRTQDRPKRRPRSKRKPFVRPSTTVDVSEEEEVDENSEGKKTYQSWVGTENGSSQQNTGPRKPSFGGWDELDNADSKKRQRRQTKGGVPRREGMEKGKIRRGRQRDTPLFLRLLISVFPFLGSWTRLL